MEQKSKKAKIKQIITDVFGLLTPLSFATLSFVYIFIWNDLTQINQICIVSYFMTIFIMKIISIYLRYKANNEDDEHKTKIVKSKIMIINGSIMLFESVVIFTAFMFIIYLQRDKGIFASSLPLALAYTVYFLIRLILNLIKIFSGIYSRDDYDKAMIYIEAITVLYIMVLSFNYLASALKLTTYVLAFTVAVIAFTIIMILSLSMIIQGNISRRRHKKAYKAEVKTLKKNTRVVKKEAKKQAKLVKKEKRKNV